MAKSPTRQCEHLSTCAKHQEQMSLEGKSRIGSSNLAAGHPHITSQVQHLPPMEKHTANIALASTIYMNNLPFNVTQSLYFLTLFQQISPAYKPPSSFLLRTTLLNKTYVLVKEAIKKVIQSSYYLNIITDESENVSKDQIINISVNTERGTFHYCLKNARSMVFMAEKLASWLMAKLGVLIKGNWGRVTTSWEVAGIDRVTILSLYQRAVYNETEYWRLRVSCCNKLLTILQLPSSS